MSCMYQIAMRVCVCMPFAISFLFSIFFLFAFFFVAFDAVWTLGILIKIRVWLREYQLNRSLLPLPQTALWSPIIFRENVCSTFHTRARKYRDISTLKYNNKKFVVMHNQLILCLRDSPYPARATAHKNSNAGSDKRFDKIYSISLKWLYIQFFCAY